MDAADSAGDEEEAVGELQGELLGDGAAPLDAVGSAIVVRVSPAESQGCS